MRVRIYKRKNTPYWYVSYSYNGKRHRYSLGVRDEHNARILAADIEKQITLGKNPVAEAARKTPLSEFLEKYLKYAERINARSTFIYKRDWVRSFLGIYGDRPLSSITKESLEDYRVQRRYKVSGPTVNREFENIRHALNLAVEWGYIENNPADGIKDYRPSPGRVRYLTEKEYDGLISACDSDVKSAIITAVNTGLRRGELFELEVKDTDLDRRLLTVKRGKNQAGRVLPLNDDAAEALRDTIGGRKKGRVFSLPNFRKRFIKAVNEAGIEDFTFHDLRHTFASWLVMSGVDLATVSTLMGHRTIQMTMRYAHLAPDYLAEAVAQIRHK
jgi:integrase